MTPLEHDIQAGFFQWVDMMAAWDKRYLNIAATPNAGRRSIGAANYYRAEGLRAGFPDVTVAWPAHGHPGLYLEFKRPGETLKRNQVEWRDRLVRAGYIYCVVFSVTGAKSIVEKYFGGKL